MKSHEILNNPFLNKGTAFTMEERKELGLIGLLPPYVQTIEEQAEQAYQHFLRKPSHYLQKPSDLEKRLFLMEIFNTNRTLFYYLFNQHIVEFNPIVYDPVIADTIEQYSELFVDPQYAAYLDINHPENIEETLKIQEVLENLKLKNLPLKFLNHLFFDGVKILEIEKNCYFMNFVN